MKLRVVYGILAVLTLIACRNAYLFWKEWHGYDAAAVVRVEKRGPYTEPLPDYPSNTYLEAPNGWAMQVYGSHVEMHNNYVYGQVTYATQEDKAMSGRAR